MADSDDEYDRKRRDKFRGERTEYRGGEGRREERRGGGGMGGGTSREDWSDNTPPTRKIDKGYPEYDPYEAKRLKERANSFQYQPRGSDSWGGGRNRVQSGYTDYRQGAGAATGGRNAGNGGGNRDRYSPPGRSHEMTQPLKRSRTEWGEERRYVAEPGYGGGYTNNPWGPPESHYTHPGTQYGSHSGSSRDADVGQTQPAMMSFKAFLQTQDDNISDDEAIRKYNEYKLEFKRQQLNDFFVSHKDEEWFKIKYHPEDSVKRKDEQMAALKNRVSVFLDFLDKDKFTSVSVDADQSEHLVKLLDSVVICLEGGTEFDLDILDEAIAAQYEARDARKKHEASKQESAFSPSRRPSANDSEGEKTKKEDDSAEPEKSPVRNEGNGEEGQEPKKEEEEAEEKPKVAAAADTDVMSAQVGTGGKKRKREYDFESGSDSGDELDEPAPGTVDTPEEPVAPGMEVDEAPKPESAESPKKIDAAENGDVSVETKDSEDEIENGEESKEEKAEEAEKDVVEDVVKEDSEMKDETRKEGDGEEEEEVKKEEEEEEEEDTTPRPRALHKTASIFLRNLAPTITKQEVEAMCKRYPGFLRVAIADPQPERRWFRRGWVTFERHVNIKEICWNLNNIRLRDCELGAIVNRDLSRRIRTVNGITSHKQVVRHDIKVAARIVQNLDNKNALWTDPSAPSAKSDIPSFGLDSKNPVLKNITDYLIEEASAEEEELLGQASSTEVESGEVEATGASSTVERDDVLLRVLDRLLFYLRIVHSVDYYNHCEYPNEDEMPNRCGIMHARGIPPSSKVTQQEISDYCQTFEQKIASFLQPATKLLDEEYQKLGAKDPDAEVEKFVIANTQELAKDKWLCPLSGKKFKGADFVRKHIFNKHGEKVDEVKKEVEYFNNYLKDPKRPQLPEHPGNRSQKREGPAERDAFGPAGAAGYMAPYGGSYGSYGGGVGSRGYSNYGGGGFGATGGYNREPYHRESYSRPSRGHYNNRGNRGGEYRPVIHYRDLDAPREPEEF